MGMLTIRTTEGEHRQILGAAEAAGQSYQRWCLAALLEAAARPPELDPEPPVPDGQLALYTYNQGAPQGPRILIGRTPEMPKLATMAIQYQAEGQWYFSAEEGQVLAVWEDLQMRHLIPAEYANNKASEERDEGQAAADMGEDLHPGNGAPSGGADEMPDDSPPASTAD